MLFDNNNVDLDYTLLNLAGIKNNYSNMNMNNDKFLGAKEGFLKGNMFKDEYKSYKNLTFVDIKPKNDREAKLLNVMQYSFAINDMNLYLDLHPEDKQALMLLEEFIKEETNAKKEYVMTYGPLDVCETEGDKFKWVDSPWTWDTLGGNMYV